MGNIIYKSHEIKSIDEDQGIIKGYASVFGNIDSDGDIMDKGSFTKTLSENKQRVKFLWQHRMDMPLGKVLDVKEDEIGVPFEAKISNTQLGEDAKTLIKDGVLNEFSVGFMPIKMEKGSDGYNHIKEVKLYEFSLVTLAANDQATMTDYKSIEKPEDVVGKLDNIITLTKRIKTDEAKYILEFELLKLKNDMSLYLAKEPIERHSDKKEADEILEALKSFSKEIKSWKK